MRVRIVGLLVVCVVVAGCDALLGEHPRGQIAPDEFFKTEAEAEQAVLGLYGHLFRDAFFFVQTDQFGDLGTDLYGPTREVRRLIFHYYTMSANNTHGLEDVWQSYYRAVGDANLTIDGLRRMEPVSEAARERLIGEARFLRAFFYYYLTNVWGDVPLWLEPLDVDAVAHLPRRPVEEVRARMVDDLEAAARALPGSYGAADRGRATRWAAMTLLVKVHLQREAWRAARDVAGRILAESPHRLLDDYGDVFDPENEFNAESIFELDWVRNVRGTRRTSRFTPRQQDEPAIAGVAMSGYGQHAVYPSFAASFAPEDRRRPWNVATEIGGVALNWIYMPKFWGLEEPRGNSGRNNILFRLADVYLMHAEAENELAGPAGAYASLNAVRARAGLAPLAGLTQEAFRKAIRDERKWELAGEGHRRWDLVRWGRLVEAVRSTAAENPLGAANVRPHHAHFPLPAAEIVKNRNLEQTAGY